MLRRRKMFRAISSSFVVMDLMRLTRSDQRIDCIFFGGVGHLSKAIGERIGGKLLNRWRVDRIARGQILYV